jgi:phosphoenolpyruvate carboxykinase (ATP)
MNNILNIKTPAEDQAGALKPQYGLKFHGLTNLRKVYWNLPPEALYEEIVFRGEGRMAASGALVVNTGKHTARAAKDKYIVRDPETEKDIWWGAYNRPFEPTQFEDLFTRMQGFLQGRDVFVQDCYAGADEKHRLRVRIITEYAWHSLFARNMFIPPQTAQEYYDFVPEFVVISLPSFQAMPQIDSTRSETFIVLSFTHNMTIIGNTGYAGEIKKSVFTALNYLLPKKGVMSMHCSANVNPQDENDVALFFGLSGTGKTTLSADPNRRLIGDDEHGWSEDGIFNYENGCYAKVINLSPTAEPQIYAAVHRFGTILENVVMDPVTRKVDLDDDRFTENTRASYPLTFIENAVPEKKAGHPKNVVFLTCDAQGVMPPIARLSLEQAMYQFISGYTSKVGGTEVGLGKEPELTFSACFGAPFMVHHPYYYAELLRNKVEHHGATFWLVNTGWVGGPYGVGKRISIRYTRAMLAAALSGQLADVEYRTDPVFGFQVPKHVPGIPDDVLDPSESWPDKEAYWRSYRQLAARFVENFKKFTDVCPPELEQAGPKIN